MSTYWHPISNQNSIENCHQRQYKFQIQFNFQRNNCAGPNANMSHWHVWQPSTATLYQLQRKIDKYVCPDIHFIASQYQKEVSYNTPQRITQLSSYAPQLLQQRRKEVTSTNACLYLNDYRSIDRLLIHFIPPLFTYTYTFISSFHHQLIKFINFTYLFSTHLIISIFIIHQLYI